MSGRAGKWRGYLATGLIGAGLLFLQFSGVLPTLGGGYPSLMLAFTLYCGMRFGAVPGAVIGALAGVSADVFSAGSPVFNTVTLTIIGCAAGLLFTYLFNANWKAALLATLGACAVYFLAKGLVIYAPAGDFAGYLAASGIASAVYSAALCFPVYLMMHGVLKAVGR